jgi:hypothetical protein
MITPNEQQVSGAICPQCQTSYPTDGLFAQWGKGNWICPCCHESNFLKHVYPKIMEEDALFAFGVEMPLTERDVDSMAELDAERRLMQPHKQNYHCN